MNRSILNGLLFGLAFLLGGSLVAAFAAPADQLQVCQKSCIDRGGMFFFSVLGDGASTNSEKMKMRCVCLDDFETTNGPGIAIKNEKK